jgi:predicted metal-dependent hydrolase
MTKLDTGLDLIRSGEFFAAHEELEDAWRAAEPEERDFYQGLVHVTVAWYQAGRGNRVGCERQLEKASGLAAFAPEHRGVDVGPCWRRWTRRRGSSPRGRSSCRDRKSRAGRGRSR